jgi:ribosome-binding protein aMBF1 (putative translation factor)
MRRVSCELFLTFSFFYVFVGSCDFCVYFTREKRVQEENMKKKKMMKKTRRKHKKKDKKKRLDEEKYHVVSKKYSRMVRSLKREHSGWCYSGPCESFCTRP